MSECLFFLYFVVTKAMTDSLSPEREEKVVISEVLLTL